MTAGNEIESGGGRAAPRGARTFLKLHWSTMLCALLALLVALGSVALPMQQAEAETKTLTYTVYDSTDSFSGAEYKVSVKVTLDSSGKATKVEPANEGSKKYFKDDMSAAIVNGQVTARSLKEALASTYAGWTVSGKDSAGNDSWSSNGDNSNPDGTDPGTDDTIFFGMIDLGSAYKDAGDKINSVSTENLTVGIAKLVDDKKTGWATVKSVLEGISMTVGVGILAIVFTIRFARIGGKIDGAQAIPGFHELAFYFLLFGIMYYVLDNSLTIMKGLYTVCNSVAQSIGGGSTTNVDLAWIGEQVKDQSELIRAITCMATWITACVMQIVTYFAVLARALQIYIMVAFSPIPLSMLGLDETRQWGVGFIKNFLAVCLSAAVILLTLQIWPSMMTAAASQESPAQVFAVCLVGVVMLMKAGGMAKEVLGS